MEREANVNLGEEYTVEITSLSSTGEGIGTYQGLKIFVDGALPNETAKVKLVEYKKNYAIGQLVSIATPSFERTEPLCPLFGECGGCQIMHLQYPAQLKLKQKKVRDALHRIGGLSDCEPLPCSPSPSSLSYRNKIQLPLVWENGKKTIGLYRKNSHEIIPLKRCYIQCPQGEDIFTFISENLNIPTVRHVLIRNAVFNEEALVIFVSTAQFSKELKKFSQELMQTHKMIKGVVDNLNTSSNNVILGPHFRLLAGRPYIYERLLGKLFKISPSAFFQVNPAQTEHLYSRAISLAEIKSSEIVLDAYCGVGALSLFSAPHAEHVFGIECIPHAIADAIENARLNRLNNLTFICGKVEERIQQFEKLDLVFLNPPRKGCELKVLEALLQKKVRKVIYISCDPATLARDLALLATHYEVETIQPFDMFPQTMHVETIVRLTYK
jgi:23S rRNA (uracil1939-C5)-methyltransferase